MGHGLALAQNVGGATGTKTQATISSAKQEFSPHSSPWCHLGFVVFPMRKRCAGGYGHAPRTRVDAADHVVKVFG